MPHPITTLSFALLACAQLVRAQTPRRPPLSEGDIVDIARLEMMEDHRTFCAPELGRIFASSHPEVRRRAAISIGRINDKRGIALLRARPLDSDTSVAASVVFAVGHMRDASTIAWFDSLLSNPQTAPTVATEAVVALGKIKTAAARAVLARYLAASTVDSQSATTIGEALLAIGRSTARGDLAPILKFTKSSNEEIRWRATWALFRPRDPAAVPTLLALSNDPSGLVRSWAVRGLAKAPADSASLGAQANARLLAAAQDDDRRVRTEAIRALGTYADSATLAVLTRAAESADTWISVSAAEGLARARPAPVTPSARPAATRPATQRPLRDSTSLKRTLADYQRIVERWIVPDYNGAPRPTARWETPRGAIELELYPGDAPLATDDFVRTIESGAIVGTEFTRVVPDFVDQQRAIRPGNVLRDEVNRHRLTRGNLSWASAGLDTGVPGYTLNHTPQPHNEGDFTSLGRVVRGMDVVDRIELGDRITGARMMVPAAQEGTGKP